MDPILLGDDACQNKKEVFQVVILELLIHPIFKTSNIYQKHLNLNSFLVC